MIHERLDIAHKWHKLPQCYHLSFPLNWSARGCWETEVVRICLIVSLSRVEDVRSWIHESSVCKHLSWSRMPFKWSGSFFQFSMKWLRYSFVSTMQMTVMASSKINTLNRAEDSYPTPPNKCLYTTMESFIQIGCDTLSMLCLVVEWSRVTIYISCVFESLFFTLKSSWIFKSSLQQSESERSIAV